MSEDLKPEVRGTSDVVENGASLKEAAKEVVEKVGQKAQQLGEAIAEKAEPIVEKAKEAAEAVGEKAHEVAEAVAEKAEPVVEKAKEAAEAVGEKAHEVAEKAAEKAEPVVEKAKEAAQAVGEKAHEVAEKAAEKAEPVVEKAKEAGEAVAGKAQEVKEDIQNKIHPSAEEAPAAEEVPVEGARSEEVVPDFSGKSLAELTQAFEDLMKDEDRMRKNKTAEAIKSAFYRTLIKERSEAGLDAMPKEPKGVDVEESVEEPEAEAPAQEDPFVAVETSFKSMYSAYKKERAEYNRNLDSQRAENLVKKQALIEELKALVEKQEKVSFPEFRDIQARWRETGPVPAKDMTDINQTYHFYVEQFYDKAQMDRDMRDLDFKRNLQAKEKFCEDAEKLAESDDVVGAFRELQKLHEQWKELGPVAKEFRESIWERFRAATAVINKKYQGFFEGQKEKQAENLQKKTALCEKVEAIADREDIKSSSQWNALSNQIEEIQKEWRTIGFASKKENQKIYDRFRAACDKFFLKKRDFYAGFKDTMNENLDKKVALVEQAEALKDSTDWKKTTDQLISLQKQWKEIGAVPRKKSEQLWKRFRAACDAFFEQRDKNAKPENDFYGNLKAKKALIEEIKASEGGDNELAAQFAEKWQAIGFVPFKEKDAIQQSFKEAMAEKFPDFSMRSRDRRGGQARQGGQRTSRPLSEKDKLVAKYNTLQQELDTYENNIGFFAASKNAEALIAQMQPKIESLKSELKDLEAQIRKLEEAE